MKKLFCSAAALLFAFAASAQYAVNSADGRAVLVGTPSTVFIVPAITLTNIPASLSAIVSTGTLGVGFGINGAGTNATTTTNVTFVLAFSGDGVNFATNNRQSIAYGPLGAGYAPVYTNLADTVAGVANSWVRIISIDNTNTASLFITNLTYSTR